MTDAFAMKAPTLQGWRAQNPLSDNLVYAPSALACDKAFEELAQHFGGKAVVVGEHVSKSCKLPVVGFYVGLTTFIVRDNFYDLNLGVTAIDPVTLPLGLVGEVHDWDWYLEQIARKRGYSFKGWTDEEMEDPRILRVSVTHPQGNSYWSTCTGEEKDWWALRMTDPTWHGRGWGSPLILEGEMGPGAKFVVANQAFQQGFNAHFPYYARGTSRFVLTTDWTRIRDQITAILATQEGVPRGAD